MEINLIYSIAKTIEGAQHWRVLISLKSPVDYFPAPDNLPELLQFRLRPISPLTTDGFHQYLVAGEQVIVHKRGSLIQHLMGCRFLQLLLVSGHVSVSCGGVT